MGNGPELRPRSTGVVRFCSTGLVVSEVFFLGRLRLLLYAE